MTHKRGQTGTLTAELWLHGSSFGTLALFDCCCPGSGSKWCHQNKMSTGSVSLLKCFIWEVPLPTANPPKTTPAPSVIVAPQSWMFPLPLLSPSCFFPYFFFDTFLSCLTCSCDPPHTHSSVVPRISVLLCFNGADNDGLRCEAPQLWEPHMFCKAGSHWSTKTLLPRYTRAFMWKCVGEE